MKKLVALLSIAGLLTFGFSGIIIAQDAQADQSQQVEATVDSAVADEAVAEETPAVDETLAAPAEEANFHQALKEKFIEGGAGFMGIVLLTLIFGLALAIERIIYLNLSSTNTQKLLNKVESALNSGGIAAAKDVCKNTRGPVAAIFYQGMDKYDEGMEIVEKSIVSYGSVLMGRLEKGLSWISLFIALAPMLGFMGTVIGMIQAFDAIEAAGDISPTVVAGGIKVALLTTVFGLIVAIILQIFYNYIISKVDTLVNDMEDSTISFIDILAKYNNRK
ncbi:MAG TPA: MotA/TolQ/ExbB proton channel family protein [Bacteroidales bacterium]|jgi:biopolymer transport protein ExbB|nr:MotA/TolQ/ExbB proton channel family protein [Lentimicrobiaceae bacterium]HOH99957.1 MotA/TolQ/ExbB proton channel family protein [Bacteroidales bacterium]